MMNHRRRHQLQHKVELPTILKIVLAKKKNKQQLPQNAAVNLATQLAIAAMDSAEMYDAALILKSRKRRTVIEQTKAVF